MSGRGRAPETILWRGMQSLRVSRKFLQLGGTELAPMSTMTDLDIAVTYARGVRGKMAHSSSASAPPPSVHDGTHFTIVDVEPSFPS